MKKKNQQNVILTTAYACLSLAQIKKPVMVKLICFAAIKPIFYLITIKVLLILNKFVFISRLIEYLKPNIY